MAKGIELLLGMGPPKGMPRSSPKGNLDELDTGDPTEDGPVDELLIGAADEVMSALDSHDPEAFATALKSFVTMANSD
jgi:hypothetical protein